MGFCEKAQTGYSAGCGKLMPACFSDRAQAEIRDNLFKYSSKKIKIAQRLGATALRVDDPFNPTHIGEGLIITERAHIRSRTYSPAESAYHSSCRI